MKRGTVTVIGAILVAGAGIVSARHVGASSTMGVPPMNVPAMGIDFTPVGPAGAETATLPNGQPAVTRTEALAIASKHNTSASDIGTRQVPGVFENIRYGLFTDSQLHNTSGDTSALQFVNRPAWVVTYYGPNVNLALPGGRPGMTGGPPVSHVITVVVDAKTRQFLENYF